MSVNDKLMITSSDFKPAWWLPGPHLQTLYPSLLRARRAPALVREQIELPDGDFVDIDWTKDTGNALVLVLHGLEGSLESHYTGNIIFALAKQSYTAGLMYFRGCSGTPNRLARRYHSGDTADLDHVVRLLGIRHGTRPIAVLGYSLGGNVLLKWLGEQGAKAPVTTAIAISVPFDLNSAALQLESGIARIYQRHLLKKLRHSISAKALRHPPPYPLERLHELRTFRQFDDAITAPLHGFRDVDDYYTQSSCKQYLGGISVQTLILHARDDPFLPSRAIPAQQELSPAITLELARHGGHVGFVAGSNPLRPQYWLETRIIEQLRRLC